MYKKILERERKKEPIHHLNARPFAASYNLKIASKILFSMCNPPKVRNNNLRHTFESMFSRLNLSSGCQRSSQKKKKRERRDGRKVKSVNELAG